MPLEPRVHWLTRTLRTLDRRSASASMADRRRQSAAVSRRGAVLVMPKGPAPAEQRDIQVPVDAGRIRVRLYRPHGSGPLPLYVFLHGGGWCVGTVEERDSRCRAVADGARCTVASVDYRMAPENAYPVPAEDCYAALRWMVANAVDLGFDPARLAVYGGSAGGGLAIATALTVGSKSKT